MRHVALLELRMLLDVDVDLALRNDTLALLREQRADNVETCYYDTTVACRSESCWRMPTLLPTLLPSVLYS